MLLDNLASDVFSKVQNNTRHEFKAEVHELKEEYSKAFAGLKAELMNEQNLKIQALEEELYKVRDHLAEMNCSEVREDVAKELNVLQSQVTAIDAKPR